MPLDPIGGLSPGMALTKHLETLTWRLKAHNLSAKSSKLQYKIIQLAQNPKSICCQQKQTTTSRSQPQPSPRVGPAAPRRGRAPPGRRAGTLAPPAKANRFAGFRIFFWHFNFSMFQLSFGLNSKNPERS